MRLTVQQLIIGDKFNQIATMSAQDVAEFQKDLAQHFIGDYNNVAFKRATTALGQRIHKLNTQFISPYAELVATYDEAGQGKRIREKIASKMDKPLDEVSDEQLEAFYNQSLEDKRNEKVATQQRTEQREKQHMSELISRSNQPSPEKLESIKKQHLAASKQRLNIIDRDGRMSEQAVAEYHAQAEVDATQAVESFVKIQTGAF